MRFATLALVGAIGFGFAAVPANAAPVIPNPDTQQVSNLIEAAGGCRRGYAPNRWGHCASIQYGKANHDRYSRRDYHRGRGWGSPHDNAANHLNGEELGRLHSGGGSYR